MAIGGRYSVRGFRENQLVRDNGLTASLEWRVPIFVNEAGYSRWNLTAVPFIDYGRSWDEDSNLSTSKAAELSSVGLGLRWQPRAYLNASLFYGERIADDDVTSPQENDLQDDGFHFAVTFHWPFD
jgi:hemolysin activation/secretion protein